MKVIISTPDWTISGVNTFHHNLARALQAAGYQVELMVARTSGPLTEELPFPTDVPVKVLKFKKRTFACRWSTVIRHLEDSAPCLYMPGYDFDNSGVVSALSDGVGVVGVVHSDDPYHREHALRMGRYWNAVVAVSEFLETGLAADDPLVVPRLHRINCGVPCAAELPSRPGGQRPLRLIYTGRFWEAQKRLSDLPKIQQALTRRGVPTHWTLVGSGQDELALQAGFAAVADPHTVTFTGPIPGDTVLQSYADHDAFVLPSNFEGLPVALLEAMGQGVIPLATAIESGIPEIVKDGVNGFMLPVGDVEGFADRLALLYADPERRAGLHRAAFETVKGSRFSIDAVASRYLDVFERVLRDMADGTWRRPKPCRPGSLTGDIIPPPHLQFTPDDRRLTPGNILRAIIRTAEAVLRRCRSRLTRLSAGRRRGVLTASAKGPANTKGMPK